MKARYAAAAALLVAAGCGGHTSTAPTVLLRAPGAPGASGAHRYEYVFPDGELDVYTAAPPFRLVERVRVPQLHSLRGVAVSPSTATLYASVGGNGGSSGNGAVVAYDLIRNRVRWRHAFPTGADGLAVTPDGRTLVVPEGERSFGDVWYEVAAATGKVIREIHAAPGPHNTIADRNGLAYLGPRNSRFLVVARVATGRVVRRVGPLNPGVRPFTVDVPRGLAYTTATGFLGFQVSSLRTGRVLDTVPIRFPWRHSLGTPSHGIALTPDGRRLAVIDVPNSFVHVFDVSHVRPRLVANVRLAHSMRGRERPCGGDCGRAGWLQYSLDGRHLFVGDDGDVVSTATNEVVGFLPSLANSRYLFELDWRGGRPVRTSTRSSFVP
jgi:DNA-binding beta-propeller fold protein YncE